MIELRTRLFVSLLVFLAAAPEASPQTPQTPQSGLSTTQAAVRKNGKSGNSSPHLASGVMPAALPKLCFQPGVGWQSILNEQPSGPATRDTDASMPLEVRSAGGANPQSAYPRLSAAKQALSAECAGKFPNEKVLGGSGEKSTILNRTQMTGFAGSTAKPGTARSLQVNSPYYANGLGPKPLGMTPSAVASAPSSGGGSDASSEQLGGRAFHAYTSSIKLRRLIRNTSDFRTRIKLQQVQDNPPNQLGHARVDTKMGQAARRPLKGERVNRASSSGAVTHGRLPDNPRTLLSGASR